MSSNSLPPLSRRDLFVKGSKISVAGLALLSGMSVKAFASDSAADTAQDIDVLNGILGTEHEGIAAYQLCIEHKLLQKNLMTTAKLFQSHHKQHRDILAKQIQVLGGAPVAAKANNEYKDDLEFDSLKSSHDAFSLIVKLERGAANAYIGMLPSTNDRELIKIASRIAADEVIHWTTWSSVLHDQLPLQAMSFGA